MELTEAIKAYCKRLCPVLVPTDDEGYWNINIQFVNSERGEDETQFDVNPYRFDYGSGKCEELVSLWKEFCRENGFKQNSVLSISLANA